MKKTLAIVLSLVMLLSSFAVCPFSTFAETKTIDELDTLCDTYKEKVKTKLYTNEKNAYLAYSDAAKYVDAVKYGNVSNSSTTTYYNALNSAMNSMAEYTFTFTSPSVKSPSSNTEVDSSACSNIVYYGGLGTLAGEGGSDQLYTGIYMGDLVWLYDGENDLKAPVNSYMKYVTKTSWGISTYVKCRYLAIKDTTDIVLAGNDDKTSANNETQKNYWWQSKTSINNFYTRGNTADGANVSGISSEKEVWIFGKDQTSTYTSGVNYIASNVLKFNTDINTSIPSKEYTLTWEGHNNYDGDASLNGHSYLSSSKIYILNYTMLKSALSNALTKLADIDNYNITTMTSFMEKIDSATSFNANSYTYSTDTNSAVQVAANDITTLSTNLNNSSLTKVADYTNLRTSISNAKVIIDKGQGIYTSASWSTLTAKYSTAVSEMQQLEDNDYLTYDMQSRVDSYSTQLNNAINALEYVESNIDFTVVGDVAVVSGIDADYGDTLTIPSQIENHDKVAIADGAFSNDAVLKIVSLPSTIQSVGKNAFSNCPNLKEVYVYSDTATIGDGAFSGASDDLTFYCNPNSTTWIYATTNGYKVCCLNHSFSAPVQTTAPTCTNTGETTATCANCSFEQKATVSALGHNYEYSSTVEPSCTTDGYESYICSHCTDKVQKNIIPATEHSYAQKQVVPSTCTSQGYTIQECSKCYATYNSDYQPVLAHSYVAERTVPSTCTTQGYTVYTCGGCGNTYNDDYQPILAHSYVATQTIPSTCTTQGYTIYRCASCGDTYNSDYQPVISHTKGSVVNVVAPSCNADGYTTYNCSVCGQQYNGDIVPANAHSYIVERVVAPTCTTQGYTSYKCTVCGNTYQANVVAPTGHLSTDSTSTRATQTTQGSIITYCTVCNAIVNNVVIPKVTSISLATDAYSYTGKAKKPSAVVYDEAGNLLIKGRDYNITYPKSPKKMGTYKAKVIFCGNYSGSKSVTYTIGPKTTEKISKLTTKKKTITVKYAKK